MKKKIFALGLVLALGLASCFTGCGGDGHRWSDWEVIREPDCVSAGLRKRTCPGDNTHEAHTEEEVLYRLGHSYTAENVCSRCGYAIEVTEGLRFTETEGGLAVALGSAKGEEINVPAYHEGKAVVAVLAEGFRGYPVTEDGKTSLQAATFSVVRLPEGIRSIGVRAFCRLPELQRAELPVTLTEIGDYAFEECPKLSSVNFDQYLETIGEAAFRESAITVVDGGAGLKTVGAFAFSVCDKLTEATLSDSVEEIGADAFYDCPILKKVTLGKGGKTIGEGAFRDCPSLEEVRLPRGLKYLAANVFEGCLSLSGIVYGGTVDEWGNLEKALGWDGPYERVGNYTVRCLDGDVKKPVLPEDLPDD